MLRRIGHELKHHAPFTLAGTMAGIGALVGLSFLESSQQWSRGLFEVFHPAHVFLSAMVTAGVYRRYRQTASRLRAWAIGILGALLIGTLSDCLIPYLGEWLLGAERDMHAEAHIGFIELWWIVNPLAILGAVVGTRWPKTQFPHAGHVLLSTAASLFHMGMAMQGSMDWILGAAMAGFLFLAVWIPCCTSDIVFPLLFVGKDGRPPCRHCGKKE